MIHPSSLSHSIRWWKSTSICSDPNPADAETTSLTVMDLAGVFLILLCGVVIAILSLLLEILVYRGQLLSAIRQCCAQFFSHLPTSSDPPITPATPKNTLDHSKYSTTVSSVKSERQQSPMSDELTQILPQPSRFDFQPMDSDSPHKSTPV